MDTWAICGWGFHNGKWGWKWFGEVDQFGQLLPHPCHDEDSVVGVVVDIDGFEQQHHYYGPL